MSLLFFDMTFFPKLLLTSQLLSTSKPLPLSHTLSFNQTPDPKSSKLLSVRVRCRLTDWQDLLSFVVPRPIRPPPSLPPSKSFQFLLLSAGCLAGCPRNMAIKILSIIQLGKQIRIAVNPLPCCVLIVWRCCSLLFRGHKIAIAWLECLFCAVEKPKVNSAEW